VAAGSLLGVIVFLVGVIQLQILEEAPDVILEVPSQQYPGWCEFFVVVHAHRISEVRGGRCLATATSDAIS